eukprot:TRINITY_DN6834_c0_g1_i3.p1 TRINITY_DN6834_c0_g1~~TRINITY_DN6834_c0_g1_i3.p1  ORF type:complete len:596 (+),score=184.53 TRINITY_DN6834_c0_g1_i3:72-1859(+)
MCIRDRFRGIAEDVESYCKTLLKSAEDFGTEPLENCLTLYAHKNRNCIGTGSRLLHQILQSRDKVRCVKENYRAARKVMESNSRADSDQAKEDAQQLSEALVEFRSSVVEFNSYLGATEPSYKDQLNSISDNEEEKSNKLKEVLKMQFERLKEISAGQLEMFENARKMLETLKADRAIVTKEMKVPREELFGLVSFEEEMKVIRKADLPFNFLEIDGSSMTSREVRNTEFMEETAWKLVEEGVSMSEEQKEKLAEALKSESGRVSFVSIFYSKHHKCKTKEVLNDLAEMTNAMLNEAFKRPLDCSLLWPIISNSYKTTYENPNTKSHTRLIKFLAQNAVWKDRIAMMKLVEYKLMQAITQQRKSEDTKDNLLNLFWSASSKFLFGQGADSNSVTNKMNKSVATVYNELSSIALYFLALEVDVKVGIEIFIEFASRYNVTTERLCQLLDDYESGQPLLERNLIEGKELLKLSVRKSESQRLKFGERIILVQAIKYVSNGRDLRNLLLLSKGVTKIIKKKVYRQALSLLDDEKRHQIWKLLIFNKETYDKYSYLKEQRTDSFMHFNESLDNLIKMDVERSFYKQDEESKMVRFLASL